jgi:hypothetical protein
MAGPMPSEPVMSGEIPADGVLEILREIEAHRITGRLRFTAKGATGGSQAGEVELVAGQIALDQDALPDGTDPVERLLALRGGHYAVHQHLPPLPISTGDDRRRTGSLAVHVPGELMTFCEGAGLTGTLTLERGKERVELVYEAGELLAIRVDGREDGDLSHVFEWSDGTFRIEVNAEARSLVPVMDGDEDEAAAREPTTQFVRARRDATGQNFLKVFEVALAEIVDQRDRAKKTKRTSPITNAPPPSIRPRPPSMQAPPMRKRVREPTVRVVYLKPDDPTSAVAASPPTDVRTRHAAGRAARDEALPDAQPSRRGDARDPSPATRRKESTPRPASLGAREEAPRPRGSIAPILWVVAVIAIGVLILGLLAQLPRPH